MNNVLILAGGFGTRLRNIGLDVPKPLVPVNSVPMLIRCINECRKYQFNKILISTHFSAKIIIEEVQKYYPHDRNIEFLHENTPLGTAGALQLAAPLMKDDFLVLYADIFFKVNLKKLFTFHLSKSSDCTTVVHPNNHPYDSDIILYDDKTSLVSAVNAHKERDHQTNLPNTVNAAMYVFNKSAVPASLEIGDIAQNLIPSLITRNKKVFAYNTIEYLKDMGSPERLTQVESDIVSGKVKSREDGQSKVAIFLDRDGCINKHVGYLRSPNEMVLEDRSADALRKINGSKYLAICVTNQPLIARGEISFSDLQNIHNYLETILGKKHAFLDAILACPHHPDKGYAGERNELKYVCHCRKPSPGMLEYFSRKYNIVLSDSWMIGDTMRDIGAGQRVGSWTVLLSGGDLNKEYVDDFEPPDFIFKNLSEATHFILNDFENIKKKLSPIVDNIIKKQPKIISIGGKSRSGKSTVSSLIKGMLIRKGFRADIFTTDEFLEDTYKNHSRRFNRPLADKVLSEFQMDRLLDMRPYFHVHELNKNIKCKKIDTNIDFLILEGEQVEALSTKLTTFNIEVTTSEERRFKRFKKKYLARNMSEQEIRNLYENREKGENRMIKHFDAEVAT